MINLAYRIMKMERSRNEQMIKDMILERCDGMECPQKYSLTYAEKVGIAITQPKIHITKCEHCGRELLSIWDNHNSMDWWPYLGNQAKRVHTYEFSPVINCMRRWYERNGLDWKNNNLMNSHTKIHTNRYDNLDFYFRSHPDSFMILCNDCFRETYNRVLVQDNWDEGLQYAVSVLDGEDPQELLDHFGIDGEIIGIGSIKNY